MTSSSTIILHEKGSTLLQIKLKGNNLGKVAHGVEGADNSTHLQR
jgi:hypothetical protein